MFIETFSLYFSNSLFLSLKSFAFYSTRPILWVSDLLSKCPTGWSHVALTNARRDFIGKSLNRTAYVVLEFSEHPRGFLVWNFGGSCLVAWTSCELTKMPFCWSFGLGP